MTVLLRGGHVALDPRLDRLPSFDDRSWGYPVRGLLATETGSAKPPLRSFTWQVGPVLDQGREGACVGFGHSARVMALPDRHREVDNAFARDIYKQAQKVDEWPGEDYEGTSVLAGAKVLKDRGLYTAYHWAFGIEDMLRAIAYLGPVVVGTVWLESMFHPRPSGLVEVHGNVVGGHCYLARGVRLRAVLPGEGLKPLEVIRYRNSWNPGFGINGDFYMLVENADHLHKMEGESLVPTEPRQHRIEV